MQISLFGVLLSTICVEATLLGVKEAVEENQTPVPIPMKKAPAIK